MVLFAVLVSFAAGAVCTFFATRAGYDTKLNAVKDELVKWEGHYVAEVRTIVARVKALL